MKNSPTLINHELLVTTAKSLVPYLLREAFEDGIRSHGFESSLGLALCFGNVSAVESEANTPTPCFGMLFAHASSTPSPGDPMTIQEWLEKCSGYAQRKLELTMEHHIETRTLMATHAHLLKPGDLTYVGSVIVRDSLYGAGSGAPNQIDEFVARTVLERYWSKLAMKLQAEQDRARADGNPFISHAFLR